MSVLDAIHPTLLDVMKRLNPQGGIETDIVEILNGQNEILDDMVWKESNLPTGHKATIRTGIPTPTFRKLYGFTQPTKSTTVQVTDAVGMMEDYAEVDKALADLNGNSAAFRMSEDKAHIEGFAQKLATYLFYGNENTEPEAFTGFGPRYNDQAAANGDNILTSAATPDNTDNGSIWLVCWGDNVHGIYPKNSKGGLQRTDKGQVTIGSPSTGYYEGYRTHYRWDCGLHVKDWRYVVRINIDVEDLTKNAATGPDLIDMLGDAIDLIPNINAGRPVFYANRKVRSFLRKQIANKIAPSTLSMEQIVSGNGLNRRVMTFDGIPFRRCDALLNNESGI